MCGVAGIVSLDGRPIDSAEIRIRRMCKLLRHRGPDSEGATVTEDGLVAMTNTRLAVTDPDAPIKLPLESQDGESMLSFNGEIYNYMDVRRRLQADGVVFKHRTDTEVLLEGIRHYGDDLLGSLDGMWAIAYYEFKNQRLVLSRDVMGERHLFYRIIDQQLLFASEPLPILSDRGLPEEVDFEALATGLEYYAAPSGRTLVKGLKRLRAGHNLIVNVGSGWSERRYRRLHPEKWFDFFNSNPSTDEVIDMYEGLMKTATEQRIPPDLPYITALSGGLDSGLVSAFVSDQGRNPIRTVYVGTDIRPDSEVPGKVSEYGASKITSGIFGTEHNYIQADIEESAEVFVQLASNGFDGMIDPGVASYRMLALATNQRFQSKVIMMSDGPDELAGGYLIDMRSWALDRYLEGNGTWVKLISGLCSFPYKNLGTRVLRRLGQDKAINAANVSYSPFQFAPNHQAVGTGSLSMIIPRDTLELADVNYGVLDHTYDDILPEMDYSQLRALSYATLSIPDMANVRADKAFPRASVESRYPFQAPEFAEFLIALPAKYRFGSGNETKSLMREIVKRRIGPEVAYRPKQGFTPALFNNPVVKSKLNMEEVVQNSRCFDELPFLDGARDVVLEPRMRKLLWMFYVIDKTYEQLRTGRYTGIESN